MNRDHVVVCFINKAGCDISPQCLSDLVTKQRHQVINKNITNNKVLTVYMTFLILKYGK